MNIHAKVLCVLIMAGLTPFAVAFVFWLFDLFIRLIGAL